MNNRLLIFMTILVLVGIAILFALNMKSFFSGHYSAPQANLNHNNVKGMAVKHNKLLYTLNFKQQNDVIDLLNRSVQIEEIASGSRQKPSIEQIIIYQFGKDPNLILTPIAYVDNNLIYSAPNWNPNGYLMDVSEGQLKELLSKTYDP